MPGWVNVDMADLPGVDCVCDLEAPLPFESDTIDEFVGIDLVEHIRDPLAFMGELYRIAKPDAVCTFVLPYGSSDDAWEDPTHRRPYFIGSWMYFAQPTYYRADYGYRGDWQCEEIALDLREVGDGNLDRLMMEVMALRNVVERQTVVMRAVKPVRPCDQSLMVPPSVGFRQSGGES